MDDGKFCYPKCSFYTSKIYKRRARLLRTSERNELFIIVLLDRVRGALHMQRTTVANVIINQSVTPNIIFPISFRSFDSIREARFLNQKE